MAEVKLATALEVQNWSNSIWKEYVRESGYAPYLGYGQTAIFRLMRDMESKAGNTLIVPLMGRLKGRGVRGSEVLEGNEQDLNTFADKIVIDWHRDGVVVPKSTSFLTELDLLGEAKPALRTLFGECLRDDITTELSGIIAPGAAAAQGFLPDTSVPLSLATTAQKNAFLVNNSDRVLFGVLVSNASSGVWATALGNVDSTNDKMSAAIGRQAKRIAEAADPHIRPYRAEDGKEYWVMFCGPRSFRDLQADPEIIQANKDARAREGSGMDRNPLFQGGDVMLNGIIYTQIRENSVIAGAGAAGIDVEVNFLAGQGAVTIGYGQQPTPRTDPDRDYGFRPGVALEELRGLKKTSWAGKQYGGVTVVTSATPDL